MVDLVIDPGPEISTRCQAHRRCDVSDRNEEDQVSLGPSLQRPLLMCPRQLSQGHFSRDNQKSLTGPKTKLLVYEAKMTRDTRLVVCEELLAFEAPCLLFSSVPDRLYT